MRPSHILVSVAFLCGACLSACARVAMVQPSAELRAVTGSARRLGAPTAFHAEVRAIRLDSLLPASPLRAHVTLELKGDELEYRMQLRNPGTELVTEAWVTMRGEGESRSAQVIQLFADAGYRSAILELRGIATVPASMRASAIADELQGAPQRFVVVLKGAGSRESWSGPLREGR